MPPDSVRCTRELDAELLTFGKMGGRSAIIHQTVRCASGAMATSRATVDCNRIQCATVCSEVRERAGGAPDSPVAPQVRATTVKPQRSADVAGAPDSVRWRTGLSGAPCDSSLHQTASLVVGAINTPNHPTFNKSKFSHFQPLTRARHSIQDTPK